ncbi:GNS1/SUR4 family-domain-containing protein [Bombardia bombarda]|uniref:Elongation of fatty acids protein n=1 Tax=Bombardia bombarda TaxID=252184 RepID=A0AA39XKN1_9PEZI|nr:GNS1/SUR4 family-domain-containing protein [Bombardia bombarda]
MANLSSPLQKPLIAVTAPLLSPWNLLDAVWTPLAGYPAADFSFKQRITPLSTLNESVVFITLYYAMIVGGREMMRHRKPFKLHTLSLIHNLTLSLGSGFLLALFIEQLVPTLRDRGVLHAICHVDGGWTQPLVLLYYLNYLTKYIELLDTAFLILKKKPLTFLHTYHHGATALLCYTQLAGATTVSWVPITLNLAVHVLMYMYYFLSTLGVRVWWKEWVTRLQIAQFVVDLGFIYFASYAHFVWTYWPWLPNAGSCSADDWAALAGIGVISSYLVLFVLFYHDTYKGREGAKGAKGAKGGGRRGGM